LLPVENSPQRGRRCKGGIVKIAIAVFNNSIKTLKINAGISEVLTSNLPARWNCAFTINSYAKFNLIYLVVANGQRPSPSLLGSQKHASTQTSQEEISQPGIFPQTRNRK
jgi:hypothetical protein